MNKLRWPAPLVALFVLSGCSLAPDYQRPEPVVAAQWPEGAAYIGDSAQAAALADLKWQTFFSSPNLQQVIRLALDNNRDLRLAALNVERAQGLYGIQRGELYPSIGAEAGKVRQRRSGDLIEPGQPHTTKQYSADLGFAAWELDFFGRIRSLADQALETYLATDEGRRSTQIALVSQVARAYFALAADRENLALSRSTLESQQAAYNIVKRRLEVGTASALDLKQARTPVDTARLELARYTQYAAQDLNALTLLTGAPIPEAWLPANLAAVGDVRDVAAGLSSDVLLSRPDVIAAERRLKGAYASIGAARAALFPRISLTATLGTASDQLSRLFDASTRTWLFAPQAAMPIFDTRLWAALRVSKTDREIALAQYEQTVQTAFREVADTLAVRGTIDEQLAAQESLTSTTADTYRLAERRYKAGIDGFLNVLDAQRTHFAAQQSLVSMRMAKLTSQVQLYAALGGGAD